MKQKSHNFHVRTDRSNNTHKKKVRQYRGKDAVSNDASFKANQALRMISDMSFGKFTKEYDQIHEFYDKVFLTAGIDAFNDKIETEEIIINAMINTYGETNQNPKIRIITNKHIRTRNGWLYCKNIFSKILATGNVEFAIGLNHVIRTDYGYDLKYRE